MGFPRRSSSSSGTKDIPAPQIKIVSKVHAVEPDKQSTTPTRCTTVATFNLFSNMTRDVILHGAPPAIGRIVPSRRLSLSTSTTSSRPSLASPASSTSSGSFLSSGLPSAERTYPLLALLEVLRHDHREDVLNGLDVLADAGSLAQILRFQRSSHNGDQISYTSSSKSSSKSKEKAGRNKSQSTSQLSTELRLHALLHENTLVLFTDLYQALGHLEDIPETPEMRLRSVAQFLTHSPLHGSDDHRRAIQYSAGGLNFLVHFSAYASSAKYDQPFIPVSHSPREFPGSKIDYHLIPDVISSQIPRDHELLVHCAFDSPEERNFAIDEMTFNRVNKLMEIRDGTRAKEPKSLGISRVDTDLTKAAALVAPFIRQLRDELATQECPMVLLQQLDGGEILLVEDIEPLAALKEALQTYGNPVGTY